MKIVVRDSDKVIVMYSDTGTPTPPEGHTLFDLPKNLIPELETLLKQKSDGVMYVSGILMIKPYTPPSPVIPAEASSGDFMSALLQLDWYDDVEAAITNLEKVNPAQGKKARILWTRASVFERYNPLVIAIGNMIGKTSAELDQLFVLADTFKGIAQRS